MALETGNYISDLVAANPADTDGKSEGDDHIRLIKKVLKNTFPGLTGSFGGVISLNSARLLVVGDSYQTVICNADMTLPLDAAASLGIGWQIEIWAAGGNVTIDPDGSEQINGASTFGLPRGAHTKIICDGTKFYATQTVPRGVITMWSGLLADVPSGWAVCDGQNGTPDLRDKFVVGAGDKYTVTQQGGSADAIVVEHTHTGTTASSGNHYHHSLNSLTQGQQSNSGSFRSTHDNYNQFLLADSSKSPTTGRTSDAGAHIHSFTTNSSGASGTDANLPPYYAVYYIIKV